MSNKRKTHSLEFKAKVALAATSGVKTAKNGVGLAKKNQMNSTESEQNLKYMRLIEERN